MQNMVVQYECMLKKYYELSKVIKVGKKVDYVNICDKI